MRHRTALSLLAFAPLLFGCSPTTSYVRSDTTLGRVVVYRNGVAYFERSATVDGETLKLAVPGDKVDDFLKSLTVVDLASGKPAPVSFPSRGGATEDGLIDMRVTLPGAGKHEVRVTYVTEAPSWKPSYRIHLQDGGKVLLEAWAIVDNTSGEDWKSVRLGVGSSSALSFRYDLRSIRLVDRETLQPDSLFAMAPPTGDASYLQQQGGQRVVMELRDDALNEDVALDDSEQAYRGGGKKAAKPAEKAPRPSAKGSYAAGRGGGFGASGAVAPPADMPMQQAPSTGEGQIVSMSRSLRGNRSQIVIEGYADQADGDKYGASLERANKAREQLIRNGVEADRIVAVGRGEQTGKNGGVRVIEQAMPAKNDKAKDEGGKVDPGAVPASAEPIGMSHFESEVSMTVPRGTSAMVNIYKGATTGEVVYLFDAESPRGNATFPFRSVRLENPTPSVLESGPVNVVADGKFIGEGLCEPIPARSVAFVPFALDRQVVVERKESSADHIARILTVQRGVFSTEVQATKTTRLTLHNRLSEPAVVYVRHTVPEGYTLSKSSTTPERLGLSHLFRVEVPGKGDAEVTIDESTPVFRTTDIRSQDGMDLVAAYLSTAAVEGPLKKSVEDLLGYNREMATTQQRIQTMREQMSEYRARMDELHAQIVTLRAVKTAGPLMQSLEKKLSEVSDKLSKATIDLVGLEEKLMVARIKFQDAVADLSLEPKAAAPAPDKKP